MVDLNYTTRKWSPYFRMTFLHGKAYIVEEERLISLNGKRKTDTITFRPALRFPTQADYIVGDDHGGNQFWQLLRYYPFYRPNEKCSLLLRDSGGNLLKSYQSPILDSFMRGSFAIDIVADHCNNVWILSNEGRICQFNNSSGEFRFGETKQVFRMATPKLMVDSKCNVWVSYSNANLTRYDCKKGNTKQFFTDPLDSASISSNHVTVAYEAANGEIWAGTKNKGISIMDPATGRFRQLNKQHGLPELTITDIANDKNGVIWVATSQFICRWKPEENRFIVYRNEDGIAFDASRVHRVFYQEKEGSMLLLTNGVLMAFDPDSIGSYHYSVPSLLFTGFSIANKPVAVDSASGILTSAVNFINKIALDYSQNKFTIHYAAGDFYGNVQYAYRLSGFEDDWQYVKNKNEAIYTNVPPGNYVFQIKVANHQGIWSELRELKVKVRAPWYRTWLAYFIYALLFALLLRLYLRFRSRTLIQQNIKLEDRILKRTNELSDSLKELKETQDQLVQREKMASLGELTAGIAHEIQNPLNFVNNFSEVNNELIGELQLERSKGKEERDEIAENELLNDIAQNLQKINHHGKRADSIVKGMLQHSRSSSGQKEPTDINALADEYIRLCYHGLRAKDKSFNATIKTDFDPALKELNLAKQDIGRVILNLLTNAFYAVNEKKQLNNAAYEPTVSVATKRMGNKTEIKIADNGNGIPQKILDKIFQPFFTTKPTGQGTGLGLSLSYDIIKTHGGELKVESAEGKGAEFTIVLPTYS